MDVVFPATSGLEEHLVLLRQIFFRLRDHGLIVNAEKCHFCVQELKFLGHEVTPAGILPNDEEVTAIRNFTLPYTERQLKRYIGMYNFFAKFVPHSAEFLQPLHALAAHSANNRTLSWTESKKASFEKSKDTVAEATLLAFPDPEAVTELVVDSSQQFVGAVLQQRREGFFTPLAFWSKPLSSSQQSWSAFERELFACFSATKHFQYSLQNHDFHLLTDHKPIATKFYSITPAASPR